MKSYIVGISMFFILIFFILQWFANEEAHFKRSTIINVTAQHAQQARQEGYFTEAILNSMKQEIADKLKIDPAEVIVVDSETTTTPKFRTETFNEFEQINYKVQVPIEGVIAMAGFLGIEEDENTYMFTVEGQVSSEKLFPVDTGGVMP